jgi:hypothetical protein
MDANFAYMLDMIQYSTLERAMPSIFNYAIVKTKKEREYDEDSHADNPLLNTQSAT